MLMLYMNLKNLLPNKYCKVKNRYFLEDINGFDFGGTFLGQEINNVFYPSLSLLELNVNNLKSIVVSDKTAWNFTLGKNISKVSIDCIGDFVLVKTARNEIIGVAKRTTEGFENVWDIGYILRREMNKKK